MRGIFGRGLRLELVSGLIVALALPALPAVAAYAQSVPTTTTLTVETTDQGGSTQATVSVTVTGEDGLPVTGAVVIDDHGQQVAGLSLNAQGQATTVLSLPGGTHLLTASYVGDATRRASISAAAVANATPTGNPDFQISAAPATLSLVPGTAGTLIVTLTPVNNAALTAPMFVTISCSGLPDEASCSSTPATLEILSTTPTSCASGSPASACPPTSTMVIQTQAASTTAKAAPQVAPTKGASPIAWAFLLPGALGLGGLAWGTRRRSWLNRLSLVALVGLVAMLGTTACNPRYNYLNHGPPGSPATPAGTYTVTVTGQTSNGVTATIHSTTFALTVK